MYHTVTWTLWLMSCIVPAMLTKNPLYLVVLLIAVMVVYRILGGTSPTFGSWRLFLRMGLVLIAFSMLFTSLTAHHGQTVLVTAPSLVIRVQGVTFLRLGGEITLETLIYGLANGLNLMAILLIFATFNALVNHHRLLRSIPAFMYQTGVVTSIAITFVPQLASSITDIREAQAIRGHRFRGLRDLLPLFAPLLSGGLEKAVQLAESMEARGFGEVARSSSRKRELVHRALIALAMFALMTGVFLYGYYAARQWVGVLIAAGGLSLLLGSLLAMSRRVRRSHYRREVWLPRDTLVSACAMVSVAIMGIIWLLDAESMTFYPYPRFTFPPFNPLVGLALLSTVAPVLTAPQQRT
jgi:energy-coupling factor transport system permease protein